MVAKNIFINNRYQVLSEIGAGGMGTVYRALDRLSQQHVALKRLNIPVEFFQFISDSGSGGDVLLNLAHEFETLASLRHPHIISVLDYGFDDEKNPYLIMELLENAEPITDYAHGKSEADIIPRLIELLQALNYLHRRGIIHRDIKPDNVLVVDNQVKLLDFGLSKTTGEQSEAAGTIGYMAPEILKKKVITPASDLYTVGVLMYEIFSGHLPFYYNEMDKLIPAIVNTPPDTTPLQCSDNLKTIISRLLAKKPAKRYESAAETLQVLAAATDITIQESQAIRESFLQTAPFVGRRDELVALREALNAAIDSKGSLWLIGGESGVGKSRLVNELRTRALIKGVAVIQGQAVAEGGPPYQLWQHIVRRLVISTEISDLEAGILQAILPDIPTLIGRDIPPAPELDDKMANQRLELTIMDILRRQQKPLLLILEDLQWVDESIGPVKRLHESIENLPVITIGTYRSDEVPDLPQTLPEAHTLLLERLSSEEIAALSASMLGEAGHEPAILYLLERETEGNVFFLVEVVRTLAEQAGNMEDIGYITLPGTVFAGGIQEVINRRLQKIPTPYRHLLRLAAIAGRQIDKQLLTQLADSETVIDDWLHLCNEAAVLEVQEDTWRFSHDKLREAVLHALSPEELTPLYQEVTTACEVLYQDDPAHHLRLYKLWYQTGDAQKVMKYADSAIQQQIKVGEYHNALNMIGDSLQMTRDIIPEKTRLNLLVLRGETFMRLGEYSQSQEILEDVLATIRSADHTEFKEQEIRCLHYLGTIHEEMGNHEVARQMLETGLEQAKAIEDQYAHASLLLNLSNIERKQGDLAAAEAGIIEALAIYRERDYLYNIAGCLNGLGLIHRTQGHFDKAFQEFTESYEIALKTGNRHGAFVSLNNMAISHAIRGELRQALTYFNQIYDTAKLLDSNRARSIATVNLGVVYSDLCEYPAARMYLEEGVEICRRVKAAAHLVDALYNLAHVKYALGEYQVALAHAGEAHALAMKTDMSEHSAMALLVTGNIYQSQTRYTEALEVYQQMQAIFEKIGAQRRMPMVYLTLGSLMEQQERLPEALDWYQRALDSAHPMGNPGEIVDAQASLAFVLLRSGQEDESLAALRAAREHIQQVNGPGQLYNLLVSLFAFSLATETPAPDHDRIYETIYARREINPFIQQVRLVYLSGMMVRKKRPASDAVQLSIEEALDDLIKHLPEL